MTAFAELDLVARTEQLERAVSEIRNIGDAGERTERRVSRSTALMGAGFAKLATAAAAALAPLASGALFVSATREARTFETTMLRVDAVIAATGGAAGRSADQLREQARQIAFATLESTEGVLQAQQTLLTFRNVQGDVFDRTIAAAADMAAALGGDLNSATMQLAKALENPTQGLSALTRSGTVFTQSQKDLVAAMVEAGDIASAQAFILSELEAQYGGTAEAAAQGLAGAQDTLGQAFQELKLELSDQLGLLEMATRFNNSLAQSVMFVTANMPAFIDGFRVAGAVIVGLASTQIPALIAALATKTAGMSAAAIAAGVLSGAMRALGVAVAIAGGPLGLLLGILGAAGAAMLLFRDNTNTSIPIMDSARDAVDRINAVLAVSSEAALPAAARETLNLTNENIKLAKSAYAAAEAELAKAKAAAQYAQTELGLQQAFSPTGQHTQAIADQEAAIGRLTRAHSDLLIQQDGLTARINEGQLALTQSGEAMSEYQRRAIDLTVTMDDLAASVGGGGGGAGVDDGFAGRLTALTDQFQTEREVIDAWYDEAKLLLEDKRAEEILGEVAHKDALLQVEELYQQQLAALRGQAFDQQVSAAAGFFGEMAGLAQTGNAKLVAIGKAARIAEAVVNGYSAAVAAWDKGMKAGGPGLAAAYTAVSLLRTGALIASMKSSGGGSSGGGATASRATTASREPTTAPAPQRQRIIRFDVQGDGMFADMLRQNVDAIAEAIVDEQRLGGTTILVGRS